MPSWNTPPHRPIRPPDANAKWARSFYYARIDELPLHPQNQQWMDELIAYHLTGFAQQFPTNVRLASGVTAPNYGSSFYNYGPPTGLDHIAFAPFGTDDWNSVPAKQSSYWSDTWPNGRPYSRYSYEPQAALYNSTPGPHLWWPDLRQQDAINVNGAYRENNAAGDNHAILWSEATNELVEAIGYQPPGFPLNAPTARSIATWDLTSYNLYVRPNGNPVGAISAAIPIAPFFFTYQDLLDCGQTGDLGHMICMSVLDYRNSFIWPSRKTDGQAVSGGQPTGPPNGAVFRLKASFNEDEVFSTTPPNVQNGINVGGYGAAAIPLRALARTLKRHGIFLMDRNRTRPIIRTVNDPLWPQGTNPTTGLDLGHRLRDAFKFENFEIVNMAPLKVADNSIEIANYTPPPPPPNVSVAPQFRTPAYRPDRSFYWRDSFYYRDIRTLPIKLESNAQLSGATNWHDTRGGAHIKLDTYGIEDWTAPNPGTPSPIFVDRWPLGSTPQRFNYQATEATTGAATQPNLWFPELRTEGAISKRSSTTSTVSDPETYIAPTSGRRRSIIWSEATNELVEMSGYRTAQTTVDEIVTWNLSSYNLIRNPYLGTTYPVGINSARVPLAPLLFTYQDLTACGETGDLGHMVGWSAHDHANDFEWPARATTGSLFTTNLSCGSVIRLKENFDISSLPSQPLRALARTLQKHGAILVDKNSAQAKFIVPADADWPTGTSDIGGQLGAAFTFDKFDVVDMSVLKVSDNSILADPTYSPNESAVTANFSVTGNLSGLAPLETSLSASQSFSTDDLEIVQYEWNLGNGKTVYGENVDVVYADPGVYDVSLTVRAAKTNESYFNAYASSFYPSGQLSTAPVTYNSVTRTAGSLVVTSEKTITNDLIGQGFLNFDTNNIEMEGIRVYGEFSPLNPSSRIEAGASARAAASATTETAYVQASVGSDGEVLLTRFIQGSGASVIANDNITVPEGEFALQLTWFDDEAGQTLNVSIIEDSTETELFTSVTNTNSIITRTSDFRLDLFGGYVLDRMAMATSLQNRAVFSNTKTLTGIINAFAPVSPVANIVASPTSGQGPLTVEFDASGSTSGLPITYYGWDFGDGQIGDGATVSHTYQQAGTYSANVTVYQQGVQESWRTSWITDFSRSEVAPEVTTFGGRLIAYESEPEIINGELSGSSFDIAFAGNAPNGVLRLNATTTTTGNPFLGSSGNMGTVALINSAGYLNSIGLFFTSDRVALIYQNGSTGLNPLLGMGQLQPFGSQVFTRDPSKQLELRFRKTGQGNRIILAEMDYSYLENPNGYTVLLDQTELISGFNPDAITGTNVILLPGTTISDISYSELLLGGAGLTDTSDSEVITVTAPDPVFDEEFSLTGGWNKPAASVGDVVSFTANLTALNGSIANTKLYLTWPTGVASASATLNGASVAVQPEYEIGNLTATAILSVTGIVSEPETQFATARATGFNVDPVEFTDELFSRGPQERRIFIQANEPTQCPPNLLDVNEFKFDSFDFSESVGLWSNPNGNSALMNSRDQQKYSDLSSLKMIVGSGGEHILRSATYSLSSRWRKRESYLGVWVYVPSKTTVNLDFVYTVGTTEQTQTTSHAVRGSIWTWIDIQGPTISESQKTIGRLDVKFNNLTAGDSVYIASPVFTSRDMLTDNPLTPEIWLRLPEYYKEADRAQTDPTVPLLRFIDVAYGTAGQIEYIWDQIRYIAPDAGGDGTLKSASKLVNPLICCPQYLPWLAELLGVRLQYPATGFTAWDNLAYTFNDSVPEPLQDWDEWESEPDTEDAGSSVQWEEIEDFNPFPGQLTDYIRWQVDSAYFGLRGGTPRAIMESAQQVLKGNKVVRITKHVQGDPWALVLETLDSETPDTSVPGQQSESVLRAIKNSIPAGFEVVHVTVADLEELESLNYGGAGEYGGLIFDY